MSDRNDLEKYFPLQEVELADPNERTRKMRKQRNVNEFTDEQKKYLRSSSHLHPEIKAALPRNLDALVLHGETHRMLANAWNSEADALVALRRLRLESGEMIEVMEVKGALSSAESDIRRIAQERDQLKEENLRLKALPSMAVFSDD